MCTPAYSMAHAYTYASYRACVHERSFTFVHVRSRSFTKPACLGTLVHERALFMNRSFTFVHENFLVNEDHWGKVRRELRHSLREIAEIASSFASWWCGV